MTSQRILYLMKDILHKRTECNAPNVDLWVTPINRTCTPFNNLSVDEQVRARKYQNPVAKLEFTFARSILREILSIYARIPSKELTIGYTKYGKPFLTGQNSIYFNISHAAGMLVIAVGRDPLGVDIELIRTTLPFLDISNNYFSPREHQRLLRLSPTQRGDEFYFLWTCKEAYLKLIGTGLSQSLDSFEVNHSDNKNWALVCGSDDSIRHQWLYSCAVNEKYRFALATDTPINRLTKICLNTGTVSVDVLGTPNFT